MSKIVSLHVKIDRQQLAILDDLAQRHGCNRSEIARQIFNNVQIVNKPVLGSIIEVRGNHATLEEKHVLQIEATG